MTAANTPRDISGLAAWYRGDSIAANSGTLASWNDSSGRGRHALQTTPANQPTITPNSAGVDGHKVLTFGGLHLLQAVFPLTQPASVVIVARDTQGFGATDLVDGVYLNSMVVQRNPGTWLIYSGGFVLDGVADANWHIFVACFDGVSSSLRIDGGAGVSGNAGVPADIFGIDIGASSGGSGMSGDIAEVIVFNRRLQVGPINWLGRYLSEKYKLPWTRAI